MSKLKKYKGFLAQHGRLDVPQRIHAGFAWRFVPCMTFVFEYEWEQWSGIRSIHNPLQGILEKAITNKLGSKTGSGFGWTDKHSYRCGLDYAYNEDWIFRVGAGYADSGIKKSQTALNALTNDLSEYYLTAGGTWKVNCNSEVSFFIASRFYRKLQGKDVIPAFEGGGDVAISEIKSALGLAWGYLF